MAAIGRCEAVWTNSKGDRFGCGLNPGHEGPHETAVGYHWAPAGPGLCWSVLRTVDANLLPCFSYRGHTGQCRYQGTAWWGANAESVPSRAEIIQEIQQSVRDSVRKEELELINKAVDKCCRYFAGQAGRMQFGSPEAAREYGRHVDLLTGLCRGKLTGLCRGKVT